VGRSHLKPPDQHRVVDWRASQSSIERLQADLLCPIRLGAGNDRRFGAGATHLVHRVQDIQEHRGGSISAPRTRPSLVRGPSAAHPKHPSRPGGGRPISSWLQHLQSKPDSRRPRGAALLAPVMSADAAPSATVSAKAALKRADGTSHGPLIQSLRFFATALNHVRQGIGAC